MSSARFTLDETPTDEVREATARHLPLTAAVRALVDATIRTTVAPAELAAVAAQVEALAARLRASQLDGPAGVRYNAEGHVWSWGNAVVGERNALAPPLVVVKDAETGAVCSEVVLGAAYEGPPGLVHGGVAAMLLDHVMGVTASARRQLTMTGTLTLRYHRGTPLGPLRLEGRVEREEGRKIFVTADISDAAGVTVSAEGTFITPSWLSESAG